MMPNKKNPDPAELVRGRRPRVDRRPDRVLALLKGLPLAYQRDLQEDKPPLFEAVATLDASLGVMAGLIDDAGRSTATRMRAAAEDGFTTATAVADALVRRGVPFRAAHHVVGGARRRGAEAERHALAALTDAVIRAALGQRRPDRTEAAQVAGDRGDAPRRGVDRRGARRRPTSSAGRRRRACGGRWPRPGRASTADP